MRVPIRVEISFWCSNNIVFGMLKCAITFDVLRHLQDIHRSWSSMWNGWGWRVLSPLQLGLTWRPPHPTSPSQSRLPRATASQVSSISTDCDFTASLSNLCQCLTILTRKKCFLVFRICFNLCPVPLTLSVSTPEKCLAPSSLLPTPPSSTASIYKHGNPRETLGILPPNQGSGNCFLPWEGLSAWKACRGFRSEWQCHELFGLEAWRRCTFSGFLKACNLA